MIITRNRDYHADGCVVCHSLDEALQCYADASEVIVIGGYDIFRKAIERADRIYLTEVHADVEGDTWFPVFDRTEWKQIERQEVTADEKNEYPFSFVVLERSR